MTTYDELVALLAPEFRLDPAHLDGSVDLADYGLDSLALVDAMFMVEEHFGVDLPSDLSRLRTLDALASLVASLRMAAA